MSTDAQRSSLQNQHDINQVTHSSAKSTCISKQICVSTLHVLINDTLLCASEKQLIKDFTAGS